jgi:hypothetical protein
MESQSERRYPIKSHASYCFYTGVTSGGRQVLMGLFCPDLLAFFFDAEGNLLGVDDRPVPFFRGVPPPYNIYDERIAPLLDAWQREIGFRPTTITVKKFFSPEHHIGIEDYPSHFEEILSDPGADEEEKRATRDSIRLLDEGGQFVLFWGNDYWLDSSGEVVSS